MSINRMEVKLEGAKVVYGRAISYIRVVNEDKSCNTSAYFYSII